MSELAAIGFSPEGIFKMQLSDITHNGLKCYEITEGQVTRISFVTTPAHGYKANMISEKQRLIGGPLLVAKHMIYRINPLTGEEHYVFFTEKSIQSIFEKSRRNIWTEIELNTLANMFSEGSSIEEIAVALNREPIDVADKILQAGDSFIHMVIIRMSQKGKNTQEIAERLKMHEPEVRTIALNIGGKIG